MDIIPSIRPLPPDVVAQIKSSTIIASLNTVVIELLKNSLDADSNKIDISVEYSRGNCTVEDDGLGIPPPEFKENGGLGKLYHSSKYGSTTATHGSRGLFLASVAALSLVSITSHHHLYRSHNTLIINKSQVIARHIPAPPQQYIHAYKHGTRVAVCDLFCNMPVRVKQRAAQCSGFPGAGKQWEELRKFVTSLVLAWPSQVQIVIRDSSSDRKIQLRGVRSTGPLRNLQGESNLVSKVCNMLSQAGFIPSLDQSKWVSTSASTSSIQIQGAISREPAPTKAVQFISLGIHPLTVQYGYSLLYDEINRFFQNSSFGTENDISDVDVAERTSEPEGAGYKSEGFTTKELRESKKGFDRWPMFFIKVELLDTAGHDVALVAQDLVEDKGGGLSSIVELLQAMVLEFLRSHHFRPKSARFVGISQNRELKKARSVSEGGGRNLQGTKSGRKPYKSVQMQRMESPFKTWSRVRSGEPKLALDVRGQPNEPENLALNPESKAPASTNKIKTSLTPESGQMEGKTEANELPTMACSGKGIRPPLESRSSTSSRANDLIENDASVPDLNRTDGEDTFVDWFNTVTKNGSLVNSRTGLVSQPSKVVRLTPRVVSFLEPEGRGKSSALGHRNLIRDANSSESSRIWIHDILQGWNNPVYRPAETPIPQVSSDVPGNGLQWQPHDHQYSCSQFAIDRAFQGQSAAPAGRIHKEELRHAQVISQVDRKFILIKISSCISASDEKSSVSTETLVVVDQHAADERCRIEDLLRELCKAPDIDKQPSLLTSLQSGVLTTLLEKPISFVIPRREIQLLRTHAQHFADWGIIFHLPSLRPTTDQDLETKVTVISLPPSIIERCKTSPKLLVELLRSESWKYFEKGPKPDIDKTWANEVDSSNKHSWVRKIHSCPPALMEMLNSRACRSAVMFNDELSIEQCKTLISRLAECAFPFQCAHGRPSMIPLLDLESFSQNNVSNLQEDFRDESHFSKALKKWRHEVADMTRS